MGASFILLPFSIRLSMVWEAIDGRRQWQQQQRLTCFQELFSLSLYMSLYKIFWCLLDRLFNPLLYVSSTGCACAKTCKSCI